MSSSSSRKSKNVNLERRKNPEREDKEIYKGAYTGEADKIFSALRHLVDERSFNITEIITLLTERIDNPKARKSKLLYSNSTRCLNQLIKTELQYHGSAFLKGIILFGTAIERPEKIELINKLLDLDCDINTRDCLERNILHRLVLKDFSVRFHLQVAELLIEKGIDINARNENAETPLEYSIVHENLEMLRLLLKNGATRFFNPYNNIARFALVKGKISCLHAIIKFYLVRKIQGKEVDENIMNFITTEQISEHYNLCLNALESLKQNILKTDVSLYDILYKPMKIVVKYLRNKDVLSEVQKINMERSDFSYDLAEIRDEALLRRDLEDSSLVMLKKHLKLPELCLEKIISHLDNDSLRNVTALETSSNTKEVLQSCSLTNCTL